MQHAGVAIKWTGIMGPTSRVTDAANAPDQRARTLVAAGGILGALAASSCCIVPLLLFSLGVSGAWIVNLTRLAPYQPLACLGYGYRLVWRARRTTCAEHAACSRPLPNWVVTSGLVVATLLVAAAVAFDFIAPLILT
jgi:mercuric ion transport protein